MNSTETFFLKVPLGLEPHKQAKKLASVQARVSKGKRVYLNTLAVYAVNSYLGWVKVKTDLTASYSLDPVMASLSDVADLLIQNVGRLECRPVLPEQQFIDLPSDAIDDRIGFIGVRFREQLDFAELLGFTPGLDISNPPEQISLSELIPLENLFDHLRRIRIGNSFLQTQDSLAVRVREILRDRSISEIVAQFERIYRTCDDFEWRYAGGELLDESSTEQLISTRSQSTQIDDVESDLQDLAEDLLDKLAEIWGELA